LPIQFLLFKGERPGIYFQGQGERGRTLDLMVGAVE
jgi:hypothetical protein